MVANKLRVQWQHAYEITPVIHFLPAEALKLQDAQRSHWCFQTLLKFYFFHIPLASSAAPAAGEI